MRPIGKKSSRKAAFTIIELLTVMSVIIILIGMLIPALNRVKRYARKVTQKNQFHAMEVAMDLFNAEREEYPPSDCVDPPGDYCGSMKLAEAMVGQDLQGFHPNSRFTADDGTGPDELYPDIPAVQGSPGWEDYVTNLKSRKGPYLSIANANAHKLEDLFKMTGKLSPKSFVLCDVYPNVTHEVTGQLVGMPILYYRANAANTEHNLATAGQNTYEYQDNFTLTAIPMPWMSPGSPEARHKLFMSPEVFYEKTLNTKITVRATPQRPDSYILLSAGHDGEYGTPDDVFNFGY
ncbi:MAG: type II secretion system protein [Planctomycetota bacterium]